MLLAFYELPRTLMVQDSAVRFDKEASIVATFHLGPYTSPTSKKFAAVLSEMTADSFSQ